MSEAAVEALAIANVQAQELIDTLPRGQRQHARGLRDSLEIAYAQKRKRPAIYFASRFAAKEALSKAFVREMLLYRTQRLSSLVFCIPGGYLSVVENP